MIDREKTFKEFGYYPETLAKTSTSPVFWKCDKEGCGFERMYTKSYTTQKAVLAKEHNGEELCQKCSHGHRKGKPTQNAKKGSFYPLPPETDVAATLERFHYDPYTLSPWARDRVMVRCQVTGVLYSPRRCSLNRYKCIQETGHFISTGAWTAKRRKGAKASPETKALQQKSQQARRELQRNKPKDSTIDDKVNSVANKYFMPHKSAN